jgi:hypothetical protein
LVFSKVFGRPRSGPAGRGERRFRPRLEQLGARELPSAGPVSVSVSDYRYSTFDQGVDSSETVLTPASVQNNFGQLWNQQQIEGQVYAQPVFVPNLAVTVNGITTTQNTLIIGTEENKLYWLDADTGAVLRSLDLDQYGISGAVVTPVPSADVGSGTTHTQVYPWIGILSTPAFDAGTGELYVVAYKKEFIPGHTTVHYVYDLERIDARTGAITQSTIADTAYDGSDITYVTGTPSVPGHGAGSLNGTLYFNARLQGQRPAVTLVDDTAGNKGLLVGFEGHDDTGNYHGWELALSTTSLKVTGAYCSTPNGSEGGTWRTPIADNQGNIWIVTGNGSFDTQAGSNGLPLDGDLGDSVVRLQYTPQGLQLVDSFTPANQEHLSADDLDLDAGGLLMLPNESGLIAVGKAGSIYLLDPYSLGHYDPSGDHVIQELPTVLPTVSSAGAVFTEPTFFNNTLYVSVASGHGYAFSYTPGAAQPLSLHPTQVTTNKFNYPGVVDTVSANGTANGIIWALNGATGLQAYDAATGLGSVLYSSTQDPARDQAPDYVKFTVPVVADGMVFIAGDSAVAAYGLLSGAGSTGNVDPHAPSVITLPNALGPGTTVRLEDNGELWLDQNRSSVLLDNQCRTVAEGVVGNSTGIFDLKDTGSDLYSFDGTSWQLVDTSARQIAQGVLTDGQLTVFDLKSGNTNLYAMTAGGWQLMDDGAGQIVQGVTPDGASAVFDLKAGTTRLYAYGAAGWQLMDDGAGTIAQGVTATGQTAVFDLKAGSTHLYAFSTAGWQLMDNRTSAIAQGVTPTGQIGVFDLKLGATDLYALSTGGWQLMDNGAGSIAQGVTATGQPAVFDLKAHSTDLYAFTPAGWQLMDDGAGSIASGVTFDGEDAVFDLKLGTNHLYAFSTAGWQLMDSGAGAIARGITMAGQAAVFDLKARSTDLYAFSATVGWQLIDSGAGTILPGVLVDGQPALFDLKTHSTDLYGLSSVGWQSIDNGAGSIAAGVLADGRPALFDHKAGGTAVYTFSTAGWQLVG